MTARWYGEDISFRVALEAKARRRYGRHLEVALVPDRPGPQGFDPVLGPLIYSVDGIDVRGRVMPVPVTIKFSPAVEPKLAGHVKPEDYPSVHADRGKCSPHRHQDDALCLYHPLDPVELRWVSTMGLSSLLDMAAEHLFMEQYWRDNRRVWLGDEAPHGYAA